MRNSNKQIYITARQTYSKSMIVLTGDRPTGPLHLGHYVGSLKNRVDMQTQHDLYVMIADTQALTDYFQTPELVHNNVFQIAQDYLAIGLEPKSFTVFIQSTIRALPELTMYYMNLVSLARVSRNPTVKTELQNKSFANNAPCGFVCYPISQAADITFIQAELVPVGEDQIPMIEQTNEIVDKFNGMYKTDVLKHCKAVLSPTSKLLGIDGNAKASKSLNNCIFLNDSKEIIKNKVMSMYTDPNHIRANDSGKVEGNIVFHYLDAFYEDAAHLAQLKADYRKGGLGDVTIKQKLIEVLENFLETTRMRRAQFSKSDIEEIVFSGCRKVNRIGDDILTQIKEAMKLNYKI